ncbi:MAG: hypothetical protein NTV97_19860 [Alphaproteobacteria bacterium]|nr:hypothetical protein [Alphaproteobacteria bacterium]
MKPNIFLADICEPSVSDLEREPSSLRRAWVAVTALLHFADFLAAERGLSVAAIRIEFYSTYPKFKLVKDIAIASKHFVVTHDGERKGLSVENTKVGASAAFSDGSYFSDGTSFADHRDVVRVEYNAEIIDLVHLCKECLAYLKTKV